MKKLVLIPAMWLVSIAMLVASPSFLTISTFKNEVIQVQVNGVLVNPNPSAIVTANNIQPGKHWISIKIFRPNGVFFTNQPVVIQPNFNNEFVLQKFHGGTYNLQLVQLTPTYENHCAAPIEPRVERGHHRGKHHWNNNEDEYYPNTNQGNYGNNNSGCAPVPQRIDIGRLVNTLRQISFDQTRLTVAKQAISSNFVTTSDIQQILTTFDFDHNKLDLAKFAYPYIADKENYYAISTAFTFDSSIRDLNNYIARR